MKACKEGNKNFQPIIIFEWFENPYKSRINKSNCYFYSALFFTKECDPFNIIFSIDTS